MSQARRQRPLQPAPAWRLPYGPREPRFGEADEHDASIAPVCSGRVRTRGSAEPPARAEENFRARAPTLRTKESHTTVVTESDGHHRNGAFAIIRPAPARESKRSSRRLVGHDRSPLTLSHKPSEICCVN